MEMLTLSVIIIAIGLIIIFIDNYTIRKRLNRTIDATNDIVDKFNKYISVTNELMSKINKTE